MVESANIFSAGVLESSCQILEGVDLRRVMVLLTVVTLCELWCLWQSSLGTAPRLAAPKY